jgi:hypothetical protein
MGVLLIDLSPPTKTFVWNVVTSRVFCYYADTMGTLYLITRVPTLCFLLYLI